MKRNKRIFLITIVILVLLFILNPTKGYCINAIISGTDEASDLTDSNDITIGFNTILSLVRFVGSGLSIIVMMSLGIKYMIASVEEKADIKKRAIPIVIGCILIFATTNIVVIISDIVSEFTGPGTTP